MIGNFGPCALGRVGAPVTRRPPVKTNPLSRAAWFSRPRGRSAAVSSDRRAVGSWGSAGWGSCRSRLDDRLVELRERYVDQRKAPASAVHLQMAGSVYCVSPNLWPTWPRGNIQVASLVNQPHGTIRRSRTDGTIPRIPQSREACVDAARESQASQASPSHGIRPAPLSSSRSSFSPLACSSLGLPELLRKP